MKSAKRIFMMMVALILIVSSGIFASPAIGQALEKPLPKIHIAVSEQQVNVGDTFEVAIWLQNFTGKYGGIQGFDVVYKFDPKLVTPVGENKFNLNAIFPAAAQPQTLKNSIDENGELWLSQYTQNSNGYFNGYGKLGTITFKAIAEGKATFEHSKTNIILPKNAGVNIEHEYNQPVIVIGSAAAVKDAVKSVGNQPKTVQAEKSIEEVLQGFKDYKEFSKLSWATDAMAKLSRLKIISGTPEGTFLPAKNMTRAEFAKVVVIGLGLDMHQQQSSTFADIKKSDWFYDYVETASKYGLINGVESQGQRLFKPNDNITRAQIAAILSRALVQLQGKSTVAVQAETNPFTDFSDSYWAKKEITHLFNTGIIKGKSATSFAPEDFATRAEISVMISRLLELN